MAPIATERDKDRLTRKKAEKLIAETTDPNVLGEERFTKHPNKHVVKKAAYKLARLT